MNAPFRGQSPGHAELDVAIIGAGFSGLCMAIQLSKAGYTNFRIFEKASDLGGTWRDNIYPGCACDVPSHLYSFSFEQNPDWSRQYSQQAEIWAYMQRCADKYAVRSHIQFDATVTDARYDEAAQIWRLTFKTGESVTACAVVCGVGLLHVPARPNIAGLDMFRGHTFHSSQWDASCDLAGKRVGVIGTGASAIQIVPAIADKVKELHLFQRTPSWILPRMDHGFSPRTQRLFRNVPALQRLFRHFIYWTMEARALGFLGHPAMMKQAEAIARAYIEKSIADPSLRAALTPNYMMGCKRILVSDDFYATIIRPNVSLVTKAIDKVVPEGIVTADGTVHELDALIYATGFRTKEPLAEIAVQGRAGHLLSQDWREGAQAYYGIAAAGYPNFFFLLGPNTGLGHNSVVFMIEAQVRYTLKCLGWVLREGAGDVEVREDVQRMFNDNLKKEMRRTVWQSGCQSWYLNANGSNSTIWPGYTVSYWWQTHRTRKRDFTIRPAHVTAKIAT
jgi:cation diffusion facilitator CzcD-associated flavoprotein CzcO